MARTTATIALLLVAALAGCIENMSDLKDRVQGSDTGVLPGAGGVNDTINGTTGGKKTPAGPLPVARMAIYETGGAKLFEADFVAADAQYKDATARAGKQLSFTASGSETPNGTITSYDWAFGDGKTAKGSTATHTFAATGGVFAIVLKVTDSKGRVDTQTVKLAVLPSLVVANETHEGAIDSPLSLPDPAPVKNTAAIPFAIVAQLDGRDVKHVMTTLTLAPGNSQAIDMNLRVLNATGAEIAASTGASANEAITLDGLMPEDLTAVVSLETGAQGAFVLVIETVYEPVNHDVEAYLGGGGEHGGH